MPYPSLSFVEYNSSQEGFLTPLVYFLAGHYLDPWDAGEGGPKNEFFFGLFWLCLGFRVGSKKLVPIFYNFWAQFWIPIFWDLGFFGCLLGAFFGLLRLSWEAFVVKNIKKLIVFWCFLRMLLFGFLMPLMVVLSHLFLSLGGFHPPWIPKWDSKRFQTVIKH